MILPTLRCSICGSADVFSIAPGDDAWACDLFTVRREIPMKVWCQRHYPYLAEAFDRPLTEAFAEPET